MLLIEQDYLTLLSYLQIHAPRYLAKAFPPNAWHMVDLRIYDRYEAYELQYKRLTEAIKILQLGYLITETWNREISMFSDPIGTYHIRLLTFLEPMELKKRLIALEYQPARPALWFESDLAQKENFLERSSGQQSHSQRNQTNSCLFSKIQLFRHSKR